MKGQGTYTEPLLATVIRNVLLATIVSIVVALTSARSTQPIRWPIAFLLMLWPTFGGHLLEVWYLGWLCPRLPAVPSVRRAARLVTWFIGGCLLGVAVALTARAVVGTPFTRWPSWWLAGIAFIGIELVAHAGLLARGQRNFYSGGA